MTNVAGDMIAGAKIEINNLEQLARTNALD